MKKARKARKYDGENILFIFNNKKKKKKKKKKYYKK